MQISTLTQYRRLAAITLFCLPTFLACGCGAIHDAALGLATIQLPPGKLYSDEFYRTATPDDVRKVIGGDSLAGESHTDRSMGEHSSFPFSQGFTRTIGVFVPNTYLAETRMTPLGVALWNTKNPEVVKVLLDAGASVEEDTLQSYLDYNNGNEGNDREILDMVLSKASPAGSL